MDSVTRTIHSVISESISLIQAGSHWLPKKSLWFISSIGQFVSRLIAEKYRSFVCLFIYALVHQWKQTPYVIYIKSWNQIKQKNSWVALYRRYW